MPVSAVNIDRRTLGQQAYAEIRSLITNGGLAPGQKVVVRTLSEMLQLSATPIKSALAGLERDGFLTSWCGLAHCRRLISVSETTSSRWAKEAPMGPPNARKKMA
jgi:DNA-binding transcriptional regulator YhcF (GntR family)